MNYNYVSGITIDNYNADVVTNNMTMTGVKENSCFNKLYESSGFYVTMNYVVDISHDILEGVTMFCRA